MKKFSILVVVMLLFLFCGFGESQNKKRMTVIFRFDDLSATSNTEIEKTILREFTDKNIPLTIGVIPFVSEEDCFDPKPQNGLPLPDEKIMMLRDAYKTGNIEIALHGFSHQINNEGGLKTEFIGLPLEIQKVKIAKGRDYLEEVTHVHVTTFIPPWNSYDLNTLKALDGLNFKNISAELDGEADKNSPLNFLPFTCELPELKRVVKNVREMNYESALIVVMFHQYDFQEVEKELETINSESFVDLLDWVAAQDDIETITVDQAEGRIKDISADRYFENVARNNLMRKVLPVIAPAHRGVYSSKQNLFKQRIFIYFYFLIIPLIIGTIAFFTFMKIKFSNRMIRLLMGILPLILILLLLIYSTFTKQAGYKVIFSFQVLLGLIAGYWASTYRHFSIKRKQGN